MFPRSTSATVAPSSRARRAAVTPAGPPPITTTLNTVQLTFWTFRPVGQRPQPKRGVSRLYRLPDHRDQFSTQPVEGSLLPEPGREVLERPCGIVLLAVEAAVYKSLDAAAQRGE